jgi:hypothetical protein
MHIHIVAVVLCFFLISNSRAETISRYVGHENSYMRSTFSSVDGLDAKNGVLVLCPGMNGNGESLLLEEDWGKFCAAHHLGLVGVTFYSPPSLLYGSPARGYYYPEQGSGNALVSALQKIYGKRVKIFLYGFSGGAQFGSRFAEQYSDLMLGWAAYSASFWRTPSLVGPTSSPGIVACGEFDAERYGPSFAYFQQGRRKDARWTWVSIGGVGHMRHKRFEEFVRAYFATVLEGKFEDAQWLDAETRQPTTEDERLLNPSLSAWLPAPDIVDLWLKLHHP